MIVALRPCHFSLLTLLKSLLIHEVDGPVTDATGGTSKGNPGAGFEIVNPDKKEKLVTTTGDRIGAGILTTGMLAMLLGLTYWLFTED
jgi:mannan endo-1,6-alpha-mannosidase